MPREIIPLDPSARSAVELAPYSARTRHRENPSGAQFWRDTWREETRNFWRVLAQDT